MMAEENSDNTHVSSIGFDEAHKPIRDSTEKGACINGRCMASYDTVSCSYRYQGLEAAKKYKNIYNNSDVPDKYHVDGRKGMSRARIYEVLSKSGKRRNIAINGKYRELKNGRIYKGEEPPKSKVTDEVYKCYKDDLVVFKKDYWFVNFTISSVPWKNQVHHVLNHSSLNKLIDSFENISDVVSLGLLGELYNINHKDNMIILPTENYWSKKTGLPKHYGSHPDYSRLIKSEVEDALSGYKDLNEKAADPNHPKPDPIAVKQELLDISKDWYEKIVGVVNTNKGKTNEADVIKVNDID